MTKPSAKKPRGAIQKAALQTLEQTTERSLSPGSHSAKRVTLCGDNHRAMKSHEATWQAARFAGYQPLGPQLGEMRYCPVCESSVVRLVSFTTALLRLLDHLLSPHQPSEIFVHSASMLISWAQSNLPGQLGITAEPAPHVQLASSDAASGPCDWRQLGLEFRRRRESAGLTRVQLSALAGIADSTIRNLESGRHRPRNHTVHCLSAVPELRLGSHNSRPAPMAALEHVNPV